MINREFIWENIYCLPWSKPKAFDITAPGFSIAYVENNTKTFLVTAIVSNRLEFPCYAPINVKLQEGRPGIAGDFPLICPAPGNL